MEPVTISFPAPARAWSVNETMHWSKERKLAKAWRAAASTAARRQVGSDVSLPACDVKVTIPFPRGARRDPHNYVGTVVKRIVDGLGPQIVTVYRGRATVHPGAGLWPDDDQEWVTVIDPVLAVDKDLMVYVELTERVTS